MPPIPLRFLWRIAQKVEKIGRLICPFIGGVLLLEAEMQIYASIKQPVTVRAGYATAVVRNSPVLGLDG